MDIRKWLLAGLVAYGALTGSAIEAKGCARCQMAAGFGLATYSDTVLKADQLMTVSGDVTSVEEVDADTEVVPGVYILLHVKNEQWPVRLGPVGYLKGQQFALQPSDKVTVTGYKVDLEGRTGLIATELQRGSQTLRLRDAKVE